MIIGVTGGTGTGKSTVAKTLKALGCLVIDGDNIYSQLTQKGMPLLNKLVENFGDILTDEGELDRRKLSKIALGNPLLNEITHPAILEEMNRQMDEAVCDVYLDMPLLFETGLDKRCDSIWMVTSPLEERIARLIKRDGISREEIEKRMSLQMSEEEKMKRSDVIINNNGTKEDLINKVKDLVNGSEKDQ